jgi:hypothetical protein
MTTDRDTLKMPDYTAGSSVGGRLFKTGGSYKRRSDTPDTLVIFTLKCEMRTSEDHVMGDIMLPACFDNTKDRGRFQRGLKNGNEDEVKENPHKSGKLKLQRIVDELPDEAWEFQAVLTEQRLVCGEAGRAKCVYKWELECECEDVGRLASILGREVEVTFEPRQVELKWAQSLENEA